jgi:hypothetical protein
MEAIVNRDDEALECIYVRYETLLRTVILGVIRDESEVDDILHDVLLQVWEQGEKYIPSSRGLRGFLVTLGAAPRAGQILAKPCSLLKRDSGFIGSRVVRQRRASIASIGILQGLCKKCVKIGMILE